MTWSPPTGSYLRLGKTSPNHLPNTSLYREIQEPAHTEHSQVDSWWSHLLKWHPLHLSECSDTGFMGRKGLLCHPYTQISTTLSYSHHHIQLHQIAYIVPIIPDGKTSLWVFTKTAPSTWNTFFSLSTVSWSLLEIFPSLQKFFSDQNSPLLEHLLCVPTKYHMTYYGNITLYIKMFKKLMFGAPGWLNL